MGACPSMASPVALERRAVTSQLAKSQLGKADLRNGSNGGGYRAQGTVCHSQKEQRTHRTKTGVGVGTWNEEGEVADNFKACWSKADKARTWKGGAKSAEHTEL